MTRPAIRSSVIRHVALPQDQVWWKLDALKEAPPPVPVKKLLLDLARPRLLAKQSFQFFIFFTLRENEKLLKAPIILHRMTSFIAHENEEH